MNDNVVVVIATRGIKSSESSIAFGVPASFLAVMVQLFEGFEGFQEFEGFEGFSFAELAALG